MTIVGGLDVHRKQITFDYVDNDGLVRWGQIRPATRKAGKPISGGFRFYFGVTFRQACRDKYGPDVDPVSPGLRECQPIPVRSWAHPEGGHTGATATASHEPRLTALPMLTRSRP
jgi:hypothetical protein